MLNIHAMTKLPVEDVMKKAIVFFGPSGYGLEVKSHEDGYAYFQYAYFQGGDGRVDMSIYPENSQTVVDITTKEWEYQVKEFTRKLK